MVVLFIVLIVLVIGGVTALFTGLPRLFLKQRQNTKNAERQAFAASQGWYFSPNAPELLTRWGTRPFTERGDRRVAFGVISGAYNGVQFTAFDFQLRTHVRVTNGARSEDNSVYTVWVIHLPTTLPDLTVARRGFFGRQDANEVQGLHPEFSKQYAVYCAQNPRLAAELLTPAAMQLISQHAQDGFAVQGSDLVYTKKNTFTRHTPAELVQTVDMLRALVSSFPQHLWQQRQH
ncbi:hypothetical protein KALB_7927 [Kutzneria albida DSM 43870]|uniref:Uncharacterized protein n=1 Tax=Kutzneria albida DSM 43870 TaxID=1449976 RepID=W5WSZ9_9PSEU|nr:hypothetical protein KALB_7927 [Kutzneria albida DSM 43870]